MIVHNLQKNVANAKKIISSVVKKLTDERTCGCKNTLQYAVITDRKLIPEKVKKELDIIIGKYVK